MYTVGVQALDVALSSEILIRSSERHFLLVPGDLRTSSLRH